MKGILTRNFSILLLTVVNFSNGAQLDWEVYKSQWNMWKTERGKSYDSTREEILRYSVWLDNMQYIEQHNQNAEQHGYSLKMNSFGDLVSKSS